MIMGIRREIGHGFILREFLVGTVIVCQHQQMLAVFVGEKAVHPFLLHQPTHEIKISLPVLHAIFPFAVITAQGILEIGESLLPEHFFNDVGHLLILENPAIGGAGQKPQPRTQGGAIDTIE